MVSTNVVVQKAGLPAGEYTVVGWDLDTTGKKLNDEFCHIAGYTPCDQFSQYVMPYKDIDPNSRRRHLMMTITAGRYRMLKDLKRGKFVNTRSEISALTDFLNWLEKVKGVNGPAIILLCYETRQLAPLLLLEALKKYQLMDRFTSLVRGFADCYTYTKKKCETTLNSFSLRVVSKVLLNIDDDVTRATDRARLAYEVVNHLVAGDVSGEGDGVEIHMMVEAIRENSTTVAEELKKIEELKVVLQRQNTLRPVFVSEMKTDSARRKNAVLLRSLIVAALIDYDMLKALWDQGRDNLEETINGKLTGATDEQRKEIVKMLFDHFSNAAAQAESDRKPRNPRKSNRRSNAKDKVQAVSPDIATTSDTTASSTSASSPSKSNGINTPQNESPNHKPTTNNGPIISECTSAPKEATNVEK